jgi:PAS domain S-box-containing protein
LTIAIQVDRQREHDRRFWRDLKDAVAPPEPSQKDGLIYWRERILYAILGTGLALGLFAIIPAVIMAIKEKLWALAGFDVAAYLCGIGLLVSPRTNYKIRASVVLFMIYGVGLYVIVSVGLLSGGPTWLFAFTVFTAVLLGLKAAFVTLIINGITLGMIGWLISTGHFGGNFPFFSTLEKGIVAGVNFMLLNAMAAVSVAVLVRGLQSTARKEKAATNSLRHERTQLIKAKEKLKSEIEERKQAEESLRESEEKYRLLVEKANDAIFIIQDDFVKFHNKKTEDLTEYPAKELSKIPFSTIYHHEDRNIVLERRRRRERGEILPNTYHIRIINKSGEELWVEISTALITWEGKPATINFFRNITNQKKLETQLQRAQKMEAIGTLAGGVAHDLNNILSGLVSYPELLLMDLPEESPLKKPIQIIQKSGEKAAAIVQDLLTLARRGVAVKEVLNLNNTISEYLKSPEFEKLISYHPNVQLKTKLETTLLNISGSPVHLSKTIMNLVSNAAEAMDDGGNIFITTENKYVDKPIRGYDDVAEGDYVVFSISDTGVGISPEDMGRIFEPFYTKKVMGRSGTGLGMAVVWSTVKDHMGYIDVQSTEGKGTTSTLYFPVTRKELARDKSLISIEDYMGRGESILIVDDVEEQREIASGMLEKLGYSVTTVSSGEEAVEYLKENSADLIVLDMIMAPGIDGLETYKRILELLPEQKSIIASGFSETDRVQEAQRLGAGTYVKKPYILEKIGMAVRAELDETSLDINSL